MPNFTELIQKIMAMPFTIQPTDIAEMLIIAYVIYHLLVWAEDLPDHAFTAEGNCGDPVVLWRGTVVRV